MPISSLKAPPGTASDLADRAAHSTASNDSGLDPHEERGLSRRSVELAVGSILMLLAGAVAWDNIRVGSGWGTTGPQPGYFPLRVGIALGLCGAVVFWQALREPSSELFATWNQLKRVAQVLVPLTVYVALIAPLGVYVASAIFIAAFMIFAGKYPLWKAAMVGTLTNVLMFYVFEIQFKVPLPKGPLEAWLGF